jgi:protein-S-isoprenylcysteine O-methyltransferase Ste14
MAGMKSALFILGTVVIVYFSWLVSIRDKRYHGIARFFAFESMLGMVLLNVPVWFARPFAPLQLLSWLALCASAVIVLAGFVTLKHRGRPTGGFENTTRLIRSGMYRFIRHPLYLSLLLLGLGIWLKAVTPWTSLLCAVNTVALFLTAKIEEGEMIARFGADYVDYMAATRMFIPFIL